MGYRLLSRYRAPLMGFAMVWVMLFHATDLELGHPLLDGIRAAGFGGVDIFILLSAMGLALSLSRREQDYSSFMARRAGRILPAYYLVVIPYTLYLILAKGKYWSALIWNTTLLYYWMRSSAAFNWYVAGAMTFYALTPFCFRRLRASGNRAGLTAAGVAGALLVCQLLMQEGYWYVTDFFFRVPVFFLGLLLGFYVGEERELGKKDLIFWSASLLAGVGYLAAAFLWTDCPLELPLCHLFLFTSVPMCLVLCFLFEKLPLGWPGRFLALVGECSLEIYLLNVSLFSELELLRRVIPTGPGSLLYFAIAIPLNIILGIALHRLVEWARTRYQRAHSRP